MRNQKIISFWVPALLKEKINALAIAEGKSVSDFLREAVYLMAMLEKAGGRE